MIENSYQRPLCNTQQQTQPALALSVPLRGPRRESPVAQFLVVRPKDTTMKTTNHILGILWIALCGFFCISLSLATYHIITATSYRLDNLAIIVFFVLLYLAGTVASFYLFRGSRWGRIVVGIVALLTVTASVMCIFAWFNSPPFSFVGIAFDIFALASAGILFFPRKYVSA